MDTRHHGPDWIFVSGLALWAASFALLAAIAINIFR
jgi:hypothetical protein